MIDPIRTRTAARADQHVAPRPGTDHVLALGLIKEIVEAGGADEQWLAGNAVGWHEFLETIGPLDAATGRRCLWSGCRLVDGIKVRASNGRGGFDAALALSDLARPGVLATTEGRWPRHLGGSSVNATISGASSDLARGAVFHDNLVSVSSL